MDESDLVRSIGGKEFQSFGSLLNKSYESSFVGVHMVKFVVSGRSSVSMTECNVSIDVEM